MYKFIRFGAIAGPKPYKFIGFGAIDVTKPYKFIGFAPPRSVESGRLRAKGLTSTAARMI